MIVDSIAQIWEPAPALIAVLVLALMFVGFVRETFSVEAVAFMGAATMLALGLVDLHHFELALSNPAPWTIAAMFVMSAALVRTGVVARATEFATKSARKRPKTLLVVGAIVVMILSAFMNNTPILVVLMPIVIRLGKDLDISASRLLIPLSYFTIIGGMLTLLGTSTNLLVDGVARKSGLAPFTIFEVLPVGIFIAAGALAYIFLIGRHLLPVRASMAEMLVDRKRSNFFTEVMVPEDSSILGRNVMEVEAFKRQGMRVIDLIRGDESLRRQFPDVELEAGDRVVLRTGMEELLSLKENKSLEMVDQVSSKKTVTVEALITPGSSLIGRRLGPLRFRRRYGVYPLAVHRSSQNMGRQLDDVIIRVGDTLLMEGAPEDIHRLSTDFELVNLSETEERSYRRNKAPWVLLIWAVMLFTTGVGMVPIYFAALISVAFVIAIRAIDIDEALEALEGKLLALIFSMLVVGQAMENSGAIQILVNFVTPVMSQMPNVLVVACLFLITSIMTEFLSNNAIAVIVTPVAIALADSLGVDARPLVIAVMLAASCAFATPIGYQTNTMVYGPGGYKFTDFARVGLPLNIIVLIISSITIPIFFPL